MAFSNDHSTDLNFTEEHPREIKAIRYLLAYLLERSIRDLSCANKIVRRNARVWFNAWYNSTPDEIGFTYKDVCDNLPISDRQKETIKELVKGSLQYVPCHGRKSGRRQGISPVNKEVKRTYSVLY